jgi:hypothetical protein
MGKSSAIKGLCMMFACGAHFLLESLPELAWSLEIDESDVLRYRATRVYTNPRGTGFGGRGGKPFQAAPHNDRPLPASYVCYRCGKKGAHLIAA